MTSIAEIIHSQRHKVRSVLIIKPWRRAEKTSSMWDAQHWAILHGETHLLEVPVRELTLLTALLTDLWPMAKRWTTYVEVDNRAICSGMGLQMLSRSLLRELKYQDKLLFSEKKHLEKLAIALETPVSAHDRMAAALRLSRGDLLPSIEVIGKHYA